MFLELVILHQAIKVYSGTKLSESSTNEKRCWLFVRLGGIYCE